MTLLTPSNLQYCLTISILSRFLVIGLQLISNLLLEDHDADAYRNKYHQQLTTDQQTWELLPSSYKYLYQGVQGFTKWDAQYFLEISKDGYVSERHLAFLPFFPIVISVVRQYLFGHTRLSFEHFLPLHPKTLAPDDQKISINALENYIQSALVGVTINNFVLMPAACIFLFALTKLIKGSDEKYAKSVVRWFCFNPASVFFSACYSESLFSALTFMAMFIIEFMSQKYLLDHPSPKQGNQDDLGFVPLYHLNRLIYIILPALLPLAFASATRSNGLVTIGFIIFQFLVKYATLCKAGKQLWSILAYMSLIMEIVQDVLVLIMSSVIAASGYISFQIYSFIRFCLDYNHVNKPKGGLWTKPVWCDNLVPHPYGHVQAKYWNVGLFQYYELKQLPNFLLATPISIIVFAGSLRGAHLLRKTSNKANKNLFAYYLQAVSLTVLCSASINIQVITRLLLSSCPAIYWICADMAMTDRIKSKFLTIYYLAYLVLGTVLHVNFYPWT